MKRFVQVRILSSDQQGGAAPEPQWPERLTGAGGDSPECARMEHRPHPTSAVLVTLRTSVGRKGVVARDVSALPLSSLLAAEDTSPRSVREEHFAVDLDAGWGPRWLDSADVLYGSLPRCAAEARRQFERLARAHPGCRLLALPLIEGGWAMAQGRVWHRLGYSGSAARHGGPGRAEQSLVPSCVHGWLTAGHALHTVRTVTVVQSR